MYEYHTVFRGNAFAPLSIWLEGCVPPWGEPELCGSATGSGISMSKNATPMSMTFHQTTAESQLQLIEGWMRELEFYETEIGSCVWSLEQFAPAVSLPHLRRAADRFKDQFDQQRALLTTLNSKLRRLHRRLVKADDRGRREELLEKSFARLSKEVDESRQRFNAVLPEFDNFLRAFEG